ncbi:MAG: phosphopantothenoylcysteine decarboxylase [Lentisphaerae bacterium]|nr:phosphopantothenoylcysteine decarboxylase [Lentisphaerota bacterium]
MRILVTAGPTREPIDPVRFLSNRSSGKMGYAIARAGVARGHHVVLVSGPVSLTCPEGVVLVRVETAAEMLAAVQAQLPACDALIMAAAVADWRPRTVAKQKQKKGDTAPVLELERTADILEAIRPRKDHRVYVGFAAETEHVLDEAQRKLEAKGLDAIVANDVSRADAGFEVDTNQVTLIAAGHAPESWPLMTKTAVAERLLAWVESQRR